MANELSHSKDPSGINPDSGTPKRNLEDTIDRNFLRMISRASGGFYFTVDPDADTAFTELESRNIHVPTWMIDGDPARGLKPVENLDGVLIHESGHHAPEVIPLQAKMMADMKSIEVPPAYKGDVNSEARFIEAVWKNVGNVASDIWLEAFMGRTPHFGIRSSIKSFYDESYASDDAYKNMTRTRQLVQAILEVRYNPDRDYKALLSPDVYEEFLKMTRRTKPHLLSPMEILQRTTVFESFPTPYSTGQAIDQKFGVYKQTMIPSFLRLLEAEIEDRKQKRQAQKSQSGSGGRSVMDKIMKRQKRSRGGNADSSAPLTKEEERDIIEQIIKELEKDGAGHVKAPSKEEKDSAQRARRDLLDELKRRANSEKDDGNPSKNPDPSGISATDERSKKLKKDLDESKRRGLADAHKVREETIETWEEIKETHADIIEQLAAELAEIFLEDRRPRRDMLHREGTIVEGLEYETTSAIMSGEVDPQTNYKIIRNPQFLETEIEFILDTSGSMSGEPLRQSIAMMVIVSEAFKRVQEVLENEGLTSDQEKPFRIGLTTYDVKPERITRLDAPLDDEKELAMIEFGSRVGGGTDEKEAVDEVYRELSLSAPNIIKIIVLLTDGYGNVEGIAPVMRQINEDDMVSFLAMGLGNKATQVIQSYLAPLAERENANVEALEAQDPADIIPRAIDFLRKEVFKRRN